MVSHSYRSQSETRVPNLDIKITTFVLVKTQIWCRIAQGPQGLYSNQLAAVGPTLARHVAGERAISDGLSTSGRP